MKLQKGKKLFVPFLALLGSFILQAGATVTLTFDGAGTFSTVASDAPNTYVQDGFKLTVGPGDHFDGYVTQPLLWHNGPANANYDNTAELTYASGLFGLVSFDVVGYSIELRTSSNSTLVVYGPGTHTVNLTNLSWAEFSPIGGGNGNTQHTALDNVKVDAGPQSLSSIPEPGSAVILCGILASGFLLRSRRNG